MSQLITIEDAKTLIDNLKANPMTGVPTSETFDADTINSITGQEGYTSLRIYFGMKEDGQVCAILVAADADGNDILGVVGEDGYRCPPLCPPDSAINV